jgi:spore maturation protein SpmA/spore maturation protein SpmB
MALNYIWVGFFLIAFVVALVKLIFFGDTEIFYHIIEGTFASSKGAFELSLSLTGAMTLWLGIMNVGEKAGAIRIFSRFIGPFFSRLFPQIPKDHPALGQIILNFSANMLGLGNAATPMGLKAMQSMQELNEEKTSASNSQIMFLVINTAGFSLLPISILVFRAANHSANPTDVFIPILLATLFSTFAGVLMVAIRQKIRLRDPVLISWAIGIAAVVGGIVWAAAHTTPEKLSIASKLVSGLLLFGIIAFFFSLALYRKVNVYDTFIEGAKEGFLTIIKLIPYLVGMIVAIGVFRSSGCLTLLTEGIKHGFLALGCNTDFVDAIPTAIMRPLSSSGATSLTVDLMTTHGVDSFPARLSSIIQGSADTTFYIVALYFGSVGVKNSRYAITYGLLTDLAGFVAAIFMAYLFFGSH